MVKSTRKKLTEKVWLEQLTLSRHVSLMISEDDELTTGVTEEDGRTYKLNDRVEVRADCDGFIASGISQEGMGKITRLRINGGIHYCILMDSGEQGWITSRYIWKNYSE